VAPVGQTAATCAGLCCLSFVLLVLHLVIAVYESMRLFRVGHSIDSLVNTHFGTEKISTGLGHCDAAKSKNDIDFFEVALV